MRGDDGRVRVFHNACRHRGNKLLWDDMPNKESNGTCRSIACKYHGWRFDPKGQCVEMPCEEPAFARKVKIGGYPCEEYLGLIFAYLGPPDCKPVLPRLHG